MTVHLQSLPLAEVNITAEAVSVGFDDSKGQDTDCSNTHLRLRGQKLDLLLEFIQDAVAAKVSFLSPSHLLVSHECLCIARGALLGLYSHVSPYVWVEEREVQCQNVMFGHCCVRFRGMVPAHLTQG